MSDKRHSCSTSPEGSDIVVIGKEDTSNYNPEHVLPESEDTIASIREWLRPTEYSHESGEYRKHLAFHLEGTGEWLHRSERYQHWQQNSEHGLLWIKGVPGSGKSVVAANMIHKLSQEQVPVLYFFFRQIIDANHRPINLLRDWLDQILLYCPPLQSTLKTYIDGSRSLDSVSIDELWKHLKVALSSIPRVYCVADALDEMDDDNRDFITQLAELGHWKPSSVKVVLTSRPTANVEAAMRGVKSLDIRMEEKLVDVDIATYVRYCLTNSSIPENDQQLVKEAVPGRANGLFLYAKLAMNAFLEPGANVHDTIRKLPLDLNVMYFGILQEHARRSRISEKTQVIILQWVTHATRPLRLLELADMLGAATRNRDSHNLKEDKDLVRAACGPLLEILPDETVSVVHHSLTEFLTGTTRTERPGDYPILDSSVTHHDLAMVCLDYICSGWLRNQDLPMHSIESERSRIILTFPFAAYAISNWNVHARRSKWKVLQDDKLSQKIEHFMNDNETRANWLKVYLYDNGDRWIKDNHFVLLSDLHLAALCGLKPTIEAMIDRLSLRGEALDIQDARQRTPLWWAASSGHTDVVQLLLQHGSSHTIADDSGLRPVYIAVLNDKSEVVRVLMEHGTVPTLQWPLGRELMDQTDRFCNLRQTLLESASTRGHLKSLEAMLPFCDAVDRKKALFLAIDADQSHVIKALVRKPDIDVNETLQDQTALFFAASRGHVEAMEILIDAGADASIKCRTETTLDEERVWSTALIEICRAWRHFFTRPCYVHPLMSRWNSSGFRHILGLLLKAGTNVNERDSIGRSAIHSTESCDILRCLFDAGADPTARSRDGMTALHCLPEDTDEACLKLLVKSQNADINEREHRKGQTPLLSVLQSHPTLAVLMLEHGSDCTIADFKGNGPLHYAFAFYRSSGYRLEGGRKLLELLKELLEAGADSRLANSDGETPLHILAANYPVDTRDFEYMHEKVQLLLHHGADINARDSKGRTPLFRLAGRSFENRDEAIAVFESFVNNSADLQVRDNEGRTVLHEAIYRITWRAKMDGLLTLPYQYLVDAGVSPLIADFKGNTICHEFILAPGCPRELDVDKLFFPLFQKAGVEIDKPNFSGTTPLHLACQMRTDGAYGTNRKTQDCFKWLLKHSSDPNASDLQGLRAIHFAASTDTYTVDRLLRAGADPFATTNQGMNVLHIASRCKRSNSVGLLLQRMNDLNPEAKNIALNQKDISQYTPLHYACRSGVIESVWLLLEAGADVNPTFDVTQEAFTDESWFPPILQCAFLKPEHSLWKRRPLGDKSICDELDAPKGRNLISGGCTVEDTTSHFDEIIQESQLKMFDPELGVSRYEGILEALLDAGADLSQVGHESSPALYRAMMFTADQLDDYVTDMLWGTSEKSKRDDFPTPIHVAITLIKARRQAETTVLNDHFLPRAKKTTWETVARLLSDRQFSLIRELYKAGADFTSPSEDGVSILHKFVQYGFYELVESFSIPQEAVTFDDGQQTSEQIIHGLESLVMVACRRSTPNMEMIRILVEKKGVDVNARGPNGITALHILAVGKYWWQYALAIPYLVSKGASLETRDVDGCTPLLYSSKQWGAFRAAAMKALIDHGADVNVVGNNELSCLSNAAQNEGLVRLLVSHGAEVLPMTIIHAIQQQNVGILRILLSDNAQPRVAVSWKLKLEDARQMDLDASPLATQLIQEGHPLFTASTAYIPISEKPAGNKSSVPEEMMEALMAAGFSPYDTYLFQTGEPHMPYRSSLPGVITSHAWQEKESESEVMLQSLGGFYHGPSRLAERVVMHEILSNGRGRYKPILEMPDLDLEFRDKSGETLLLAACRRWPSAGAENRIPLRLLLERGADPFAVDNYGRNAMHHKLGSRALSSEKLEAIKDLEGAVPHLINQVDAKGYRPLHYGLAAVVWVEISQTEQPSWMDYIISQGADMLAADGLGNNALHYLAPTLLGSLGYVGDDTKILFKKFLDMGLDINTRNKAGQTPMFFLVSDRRGDSLDEIMSWLDGLGVDWQAKDEQKRTILHEIAGEPVKLFKAVMSRGVDPLAEDIDGRTSLDLAAAHGNDDVLKLFDREGK